MKSFSIGGIFKLGNRGTNQNLEIGAIVVHSGAIRSFLVQIHSQFLVQ